MDENQFFRAVRPDVENGEVGAQSAASIDNGGVSVLLGVGYSVSDDRDGMGLVR